MWTVILDGHPLARQIADRHYSRGKPGTPLFVGPGEKLILLSDDYKALFAWRKAAYRLDSQTGVECTIFRNEGKILSSELIKDACLWAWQKWPGERLFTYVNPGKIKSTNPGYCFLKAGWEKAGKNKSGKLVVLENYNYINRLPKNYRVQLSMEILGREWKNEQRT